MQYETPHQELFHHCCQNTKKKYLFLPNKVVWLSFDGQSMIKVSHQPVVGIIHQWGGYITSKKGKTESFASIFKHPSWLKMKYDSWPVDKSRVACIYIVCYKLGWIKSFRSNESRPHFCKFHKASPPKKCLLIQTPEQLTLMYCH